MNSFSVLIPSSFCSFLDWLPLPGGGDCYRSTNLHKVASTGCIVSLAAKERQSSRRNESATMAAATAFSALHPAMMANGGGMSRSCQRLRPLHVVGKGGKVFAHPALAIPGGGGEADRDWSKTVEKRNGRNGWRRRRPKLQRQLSMIDLDYDLEFDSLGLGLAGSDSEDGRESDVQSRYEVKLTVAKSEESGEVANTCESGLTSHQKPCM
jgi:hypothetical protein